jgi:glycerol uptake facilitator-like aquaporin
MINPLLGTLAGAAVIAGALLGLMLALGPASGAHFNPLVTGLQWFWGQRAAKCTLSYIGAQVVGAVTGSVFGNFLFNLSTSGERTSPSWQLSISEFGCTAGLMIVVFGCSRGGKGDVGPFAVVAWLITAIVATPSGSYANPAMTLAAIAMNGPGELSPAIAASYFPAQLLGALIAFLAISICYPDSSGHSEPAPFVSADVVEEQKVG